MKIRWKIRKEKTDLEKVPFGQELAWFGGGRMLSEPNRERRGIKA